MIETISIVSLIEPREKNEKTRLDLKTLGWLPKPSAIAALVRSAADLMLTY